MCGRRQREHVSRSAVRRALCLTTDLGGAETGRGRSIERANGLRDGASTVASSGFYSVHEKVKLIISTVFTAAGGSSVRIHSILSIGRTRRGRKQGPLQSSASSSTVRGASPGRLGGAFQASFLRARTIIRAHTTARCPKTRPSAATSSAASARTARAAALPTLHQQRTRRVGGAGSLGTTWERSCTFAGGSSSTLAANGCRVARA